MGGSIIARYAHRPWGRLTVKYGIGPLQALTDRYARYRTIPDHPGPSPAVPSGAERLFTYMITHHVIVFSAKLELGAKEL